MYAQSTRSGAFTPGYDLGFSPNDMGSPGNFYASPTHVQASPGYGSPMNPGSSPIYMAQNIGQPPAYAGSSPIYQMPQIPGATAG